MKIRFDYIVVAISVTLIMILVIYLMDSVFASSYNNKFHKYDTDFTYIASEYQKRNFDNVISRCDLILRECEQGANDIRAKSYKALANLEIGLQNKSILIINGLINDYPGIQMVYSDYVKTGTSYDNLVTVFNSILKDYLKASKDAVNSGMTLTDMFNAMDGHRWRVMIFILSGSLVIYDRVRAKIISNKTNTQ